MPTWSFIAIAIVGWAFWGITEKLAVKNMSPMVVQLTSAYVYSAIAPLAYLFMKARGDIFDWNARGILWTSTGAILATIAGYAFLFAIEKMEVHRVIAFTSVYPILTFALSYIFLGESVTWWKMFGIVMICMGTMLATR